MAGYTKMFSSILDSTVWDLPLPTKVVWITMLAMSDQHGEVQASVPGLAKRAGVSLAECETALAAFMSHDPYSRSKVADGRRIVSVDGGWLLINHRKYTQMLSPEDRRERGAERQRRHRDKVRGAGVDEIAERDGYVCGICAKSVDKSDVEVDHIIPLSRGGRQGITNLQLAHPFCNQSKHNGRSGVLRHPSLVSVTEQQGNNSTQDNYTQTQTQTQIKTKTEDQIPPNPPSGGIVVPSYPKTFEIVWEQTGKRGNKYPALAAWEKVGRPGWDAIGGAWADYLVSDGPSRGFIQNLSTWLNGRGHTQSWQPAVTKAQSKQAQPQKSWQERQGDAAIAEAMERTR